MKFATWLGNDKRMNFMIFSRDLDPLLDLVLFSHPDFLSCFHQFCVVDVVLNGGPSGFVVAPNFADFDSKRFR